MSEVPLYGSKPQTLSVVERTVVMVGAEKSQATATKVIDNATNRATCGYMGTSFINNCPPSRTTTGP